FTDPNYVTTGSCSAANNYTSSGTITTPMETYSQVMYCGDGICSSEIGENSASCPIDCPAPTSLIVTANPPAVPADGTQSTIIATARGPAGLMQGVQVLFVSTPIGNLDNVLAITNSSGNAVVHLSSTQVGTATVTATAVISNSTTVNFYICGNGVCEIGETYASCPDDCCDADCTALNPSAVSDNTCHAECNGHAGCLNFIQNCNLQAPGAMACDSEGFGKGKCCSGQIISCGTTLTTSCPSDDCSNGLYNYCTYSQGSCSNTCYGGSCVTCSPSCVRNCNSCPINSQCPANYCGPLFGSINTYSLLASCQEQCFSGSCQSCTPTCSGPTLGVCDLVNATCPPDYCQDSNTICFYQNPQCQTLCNNGSCEPTCTPPSNCSSVLKCTSCGGTKTQTCLPSYCQDQYTYCLNRSICDLSCSGTPGTCDCALPACTTSCSPCGVNTTFPGPQPSGGCYDEGSGYAYTPTACNIPCVGNGNCGSCTNSWVLQNTSCNPFTVCYNGACVSCGTDCPTCGDHTCDSTYENCQNCPQDCGPC
ncbi:Ig-like domain-containing protein, partial [Candidatus Micrarchaeota archaeon]|nr:Ig-like domain-containing protein [Candidatus Micrarchaeota archaeon]